ncbi:Sensory transduction histidine kinase [Rhodopirellula islandica]|uniref:histidine kinase n=1 Tax=Rhodopirellula islandica TaxID=595434 RepID=A0A0J1BFU0_RHOIS|nr:hybrid sensor histidine kinase/response regulator [Rhodopirellula islandica]KLU05406.1 Sensory transduction histidine kinase [Rhodopirellula islandica]
MLSHQPIRILLLEDNSIDAEAVSRQLRKASPHFKFTWAETLAKAKTELGENEYDLIIADLSVPDSSGTQTISILREQCSQTPVIALTGLDDEKVEQAAIKAGAQDYIVKGELHGQALARTILHAIHRQVAENQTRKLVNELRVSQQDLKEQKQLLLEKNKKLEKLYSTSQEIVDNVSHDLRTPLTVIKDYVAIIHDGLVGEINPEQTQMLGKILGRADDLNGMVDDLLDKSKLEAGLLQLSRRAQSLDSIVQRVQMLVANRAASKQVTLRLISEDGDISVYCDAEKMTRVITNLATNAIKFVPQGGNVTLRTKRSTNGEDAVVEVADNGPGIEASELTKIFGRFEQASHHGAKQASGVGLGLNIAQKLVALNFGRIDVASEIGNGTVFRLSIPLPNPACIAGRMAESRASKLGPVSLISLCLPEAKDQRQCDDFERFMCGSFRAEDLLFRKSDNRWLLLFSGNRSDLTLWLQRTESDFEQMNRNRPFGALPGFTASFFDDDGRDDIETVKKLLQQEWDREEEFKDVADEPTFGGEELPLGTPCDLVATNASLTE